MPGEPGTPSNTNVEKAAHGLEDDGRDPWKTLAVTPRVPVGDAHDVCISMKIIPRLLLYVVAPNLAYCWKYVEATASSGTMAGSDHGELRLARVLRQIFRKT
jgi:hypothetical protein